MDTEALLKGYKNKTCIISVERFPDGKYGNVRIAAGNKAHCDDMLRVMGKPFVPDSPYYEYLPENKNFEDFCYRCAFLGQPLHAYVPLPQMGLWLNMFLLPLESDEENVGYCVYSYDVTPDADAEKTASLSAGAASAVIETCIKLRGSTDIRATFGEVIEDVRRICDSDRCCIILVNENGRNPFVFCEALRPGIEMQKMTELVDDGFYKICKTFGATIGDSSCVIIKDEQDMEWLETVNPLWRDSLRRTRARSVILFPLVYGGRTLGYMHATNFNAENTVKIKETLELATFFIASEIANYQLMNKLEELGSMDMLTKVKNRNAMNNYVNEVVAGKTAPKYPCAVIFADLNGLKRVNDEEGHAAGDRLLKNAAAILRGVFFDCEVYRAGGDEFMIVAPETDEAVFKERAKRLAEQSSDANAVSFAIGAGFMKEGDDIRAAMRAADENMYANKDEYYARNPERKYR